MKKLLYFIPVVIFLSACGNGSTGGGVALPMSNEIDSVSYAYGVSVSESLIKIEEDLGEGNGMDVNLFKNGIEEGVAGNSRIAKEDIQGILGAFGQKMQQATQQKQQEKDLANVALGQEYLAKNKSADGVQVTPSGLQYKVIEAGTGAQPLATDDVTVHYTGKLIDGTVFDSSIPRGQPTSFNVSGVIPGWTEGLQLMKEGAKYEFFIPSNLGYGPRGSAPQIPGNSVLIFEVELLKIGK